MKRACKKEFGFNHEKSTIFAKKLIIWWIVIYIIFSFFFSPYLSRIFLINELVRTLIYVLFWLALVYLIKDLTTDKIRQLIWIAFFSSIIFNLISNVSIQILAEFYDNIVIPYVILILIAAIIPPLLFIYCYYKTYELLKIPKYNNEKNL